MSIKEKSEIKIIYDFEKQYKEFTEDDCNLAHDDITIFGYDFVKNNKDKCKMIIYNQEYELQSKFDIGYCSDKLEITLKGILKYYKYELDA